ncbi:hypothetical protein BGX27_004490 [Mortierella sp. AM989]|nr:hypothetical protein BGX27_004490 [Mortierella sp. AM989]
MSQLSEEEIADYQEAFNTFDTDGSGSISRSELRSLLTTIGQKRNAKGLQDLLEEADVDKSGTISFPEFLTLIDRLVKNKSSTTNFSKDELASLKESFDHVDRDSNGSINTTELRSLLRLVGEKFDKAFVNSTLQEFDTNKDQQIDFDEFLVMANKLIKNKSN